MLDKAFWGRLDEIAAKLKADPLDLLNVMLSESGVNPAAHNKGGDASGLIQFMPATLRGLGWTSGHEEFRKLSAVDQLEWVLKYFTPYVKYGLDSAARIYLFTFLPALGADPTSRQDGYILCGSQGPFARFYRDNAVLDTDKNLYITVGDLRKRLERLRTSGTWAQLMASRSGSLSGVTWEQVQTLLRKLGTYSGAIDGKPGPMTAKAVYDALNREGQ